MLRQCICVFTANSLLKTKRRVPSDADMLSDNYFNVTDKVNFTIMISFSQYVDPNTCVDCDPDDAVGCEEGLICGVNNCKQFHELGDITGIRPQTDCCESIGTFSPLMTRINEI